MNLSSLNEAAIVVALIVAIVALVVVVVVTGAASLPATGLRDLVMLLGGALAGIQIQKP